MHFSAWLQRISPVNISGGGHIQDHSEYMNTWDDHMRWPHDFQPCHSRSQDVLGIQSPLVRVFTPFFTLYHEHSVTHQAAFHKWAFSLLPFNSAIGLSVTVCYCSWLTMLKRNEEGSRRLQGRSWPYCPEGKQDYSALALVILGMLCQYPYPMRWLKGI